MMFHHIRFRVGRHVQPISIFFNKHLEVSQGCHSNSIQITGVLMSSPGTIFVYVIYYGLLSRIYIGSYQHAFTPLDRLTQAMLTHTLIQLSLYISKITKGDRR